MITPDQYQNLGGDYLSDITFPSYYKPNITKNDYSKGYVNRYLVQKINDLTITEVNKENYNGISKNYYNKLVIQWIISGPKNNQYNNKILEIKGVQEQNIKTLNDGEKNMKGLKTYYPLEFMFSILKNENDKDARTEYLIEAKRLGLKVLLPHINESDVYFSLQKEAIRFGLAEVKFISDSIANKIIEKRPYANYKDFIEKSSKKGSGINSRAVSALNAIGGAAFDDNARQGTEKENYYEFLGIPTFSLDLPPRIKAQARPISEFDDLGSFVMFGMVKSIKRGNGWARVELVDETGSIGLFHNEQTPIETNQMYFILVGDNRIAKYIKVSDIDPKSTDIFVDYLYRKEYDLADNEYIVVNFTPYKTKAGKTMAHIVLSDRDKNLTRAIVFSSMYKIALAKMREGMKCQVILSKLDDGTLMIKEIK